MSKSQNAQNQTVNPEQVNNETTKVAEIQTVKPENKSKVKKVHTLTSTVIKKYEPQLTSFANSYQKTEMSKKYAKFITYVSKGAPNTLNNNDNILMYYMLLNKVDVTKKRLINNDLDKVIDFYTNDTAVKKAADVNKYETRVQAYFNQYKNMYSRFIDVINQSIEKTNKAK